MDHKLATQLKDAGFPQSFKRTSRWYRSDKKQRTDFGIPWLRYPNATDIDPEDWTTKIPTLEELIDACGKYFEQVIRWEVGEWAAYAIAGDREFIGKGATAAEAVARLWLSLNDHLNTMEQNRT